MKTIEINGQKYVKNVDLINAIGLINTWCLINRIEHHIEVVTEVKFVLELEVAEAKKELDEMIERHGGVQNILDDEDLYSGYENRCETWSTLGMDLEKVIKFMG